MLNILYDDKDEKITHKERGSERIKRDNDDVLRIAERFERFQEFNPAIQDDLVGLTTGDVVTEDIKTDLMNAEDNGRKKLHEFVTESLVDQKVEFHSPLKSKILKQCHIFIRKLTNL